MSDKESKSVQNRSSSVILKWSIMVVGILILEATAIFSAVKITEMRGKADTAKLQDVYNKLSAQQAQINVLERLPASITAVSQQLGSNAQNLNTLINNFNQLTEEVGNNKIADIVEKTEKINHRLALLEENSRGETLVLNLALIIKENILYQRPFVQEADVLDEISKHNTDLKPFVEVIIKYKNQSIKNNIQLAQQYADLAQTFSFANATEEQVGPEKQGVVAKGVEMLKGTVSKINFDKVVVLKKDKLSEQQLALMNKLNNLVQNYNYGEALSVLEEHREIKTTDKQGLEVWKKDVTDKLSIEKALSEIITKQLSALRQDVENKVVQKNITKTEKIIENQTEAEIKENEEQQFNGEELVND